MRVVLVGWLVGWLVVVAVAVVVGGKEEGKKEDCQEVEKHSVCHIFPINVSKHVPRKWFFSSFFVFLLLLRSVPMNEE